jgi:hypothetical protein
MTKTEIILTILEHGAEVTPKLLYLYGTVSYRESARRLGHLMDGDEKRRRFDWVASLKEAQNFYSMLSHLKAEGFIKKQKADGLTSWRIVGKGLKKVREMRIEASSGDLLSRYAEAEDSSLKVIIFDIPERDRRKRAWLRSALSSMGFSLLQKSVWIGKKKIPRDFFLELQRKKIFRNIHVFAVTSAGTFRSVGLKV